MNKNNIELHAKTLNIENLLMNNLNTEEDIREWLTISLEEYAADNDFNAFFKALECAVKAKSNISKISQGTGVSRSNLYKMFNGEQSPQFNTVMKVLKELGYTIKIA